MDNFSQFTYLILIVFILVGAGILGAILFLSYLIQPTSKPNPDKTIPYECGNIPIGKPWIKFRIHYYLFALIFVIFDAAFIFLFPWAVGFKMLGIKVFLVVVIFLGLISLGLTYTLREKILKWI